ncbi:hypothetical protein LQZ18_11135 [Lachnospiraceae bacterium ZAX-1]
MINKKEYIRYVGSASEFKKHLFACALRNGYGRYQDTVVLSDGDIKNQSRKRALHRDVEVPFLKHCFGHSLNI